MTRQWLGLFKVGYCIGIAILFIRVVAFNINQRSNDSEKKKAAAVFCIASATFPLGIWLIAATKLRFGKIGRICAGEFLNEETPDKELYMELTGEFLK